MLFLLNQGDAQQLDLSGTTYKRRNKGLNSVICSLPNHYFPSEETLETRQLVPIDKKSELVYVTQLSHLLCK